MGHSHSHPAAWVGHLATSDLLDLCWQRLGSRGLLGFRPERPRQVDREEADDPTLRDATVVGEERTVSAATPKGGFLFEGRN